jgi:DNA-binding CsgD family transcriptional regulator
MLPRPLISLHAQRNRPVKVRIEAEDPEAERLIALAVSEGLVLAGPDEAADLVAQPARPAGLAAPPERPAVEAPPLRAAPRLAASPLLSRRELEILEYLVDGWSNAEIASALRVKVRTVRFHLEAVYAKLGVSRRGEAAREALSLGLVRFDV